MEGTFAYNIADSMSTFTTPNGTKFLAPFEENTYFSPVVLPYFEYRVKEQEEIPRKSTLEAALGIAFKKDYEGFVYNFCGFNKFWAEIKIEIFYESTNIPHLKKEFKRTEPRLVIFKKYKIDLSRLLELDKIPHYDLLLLMLKHKKEEFVAFNDAVLEYAKSIPAPTDEEKERFENGTYRWSRFNDIIRGYSKTFIFIDEA